MTEQVKDGDIIRLHYTGRLADGEIFDSTRERGPIVLVVGTSQLVKGIDRAVMGMKTGDTKTVHLTPDQAYGEYLQENILEFSLHSMPHLQNFKVGMQIKLPLQGGRAVSTRVIEVTDSLIRLDANHPLAGKNLNYDLEVVETGLDPSRLYAEAVVDET